MKTHSIVAASFLTALAGPPFAGQWARAEVSAPPDTPPTEADWKAAPESRLSRNTRDECGARQIEHPNPAGTPRTPGAVHWLRVTCSGQIGQISPVVVVAAGPGDDVDIDLSGNWLRVTFPVRRGDRRVMLMSSSEIGLSAVWLPDEPRPTVVVE